MPWKSVPICDDCWSEANPPELHPTRVRDAVGFCYICGDLTAGIFLRMEVPEEE